MFPRASGFMTPTWLRQHCRLNVVDILVELTNTVFVNSTNITKNIETAALSN